MQSFSPFLKNAKVVSQTVNKKTANAVDFSNPRILHMVLMWMYLNFILVPNANHISAAGCC